MQQHSSQLPLHLLIPLSVTTDSYKAGHFTMYPEANKMVAYGEFRKSYDGNKSDNRYYPRNVAGIPQCWSFSRRFVYYGIRYLVETYLNRQWTKEDVEKAEKFYSTHNAGKIPYPFPKDLFLKFIEENNGYFPIKLQALPEGTCAHIHVPVYQITAEKEYARLITYWETILTHV